MWNAEKLRTLRDRLGVSTAELAATLRVSESCARHWLNGTRSVSGPACVLLDELDSGSRLVVRAVAV